MVAAGTLIWISVRPLLRLTFCVACGFAITKADIFPPVAARGAGQIMLNIALPCLLFSKMVPAFSSDNIGALGPLVLVAILYEAMGIVIAWMIKQVFWVPHRFRYGILVAGGWGNYGDIPTSVVMSITGAAPFNGNEDQTLSVAYIAAFILVYMVTFFPCGGHRWIAMDFDGPDVEPEEVKEAVRRRRQFLLYGWPGWIWRRVTGKQPPFSFGGKDIPKVEDIVVEPKQTSTGNDNEISRRRPPARTKHVSFYQDNDNETAVAQAEDRDKSNIPFSSPSSPSPSVYASPSRLTSPAPTVTAVDALWTSPNSPGGSSKPVLPTVSEPAPSKEERQVESPPSSTFKKATLAHLKTAFKSLITPASLAILISFPIALIPPVKALFVEVPGTYMPSAPDGEPPLSFVIDTASFVGAASVPLGLICLGSALARLKLPGWSWEEWKVLPLGAIGMLAVGKILIFPVLGVLITEGLVKAGLIPEDDKVLRFVCIFFSCLPTATTQVFVTQVYSGTGSADDIPAFLVPQYILMFISMTALTAYTIQSLF